MTFQYPWAGLLALAIPLLWVLLRRRRFSRLLLVPHLAWWPGAGDAKRSEGGGGRAVNPLEFAFAATSALCLVAAAMAPSLTSKNEPPDGNGTSGLVPHIHAAGIDPIGPKSSSASLFVSIRNPETMPFDGELQIYVGGVLADLVAVSVPAGMEGESVRRLPANAGSASVRIVLTRAAAGHEQTLDSVELAANQPGVQSAVVLGPPDRFLHLLLGSLPGITPRFFPQPGDPEAEQALSLADMAVVVGNLPEQIAPTKLPGAVLYWRSPMPGMQLARIDPAKMPADEPSPRFPGDAARQAWSALPADGTFGFVAEGKSTEWNIEKFWEVGEKAVLIRAEREYPRSRVVGIGASPELRENSPGVVSLGALVFFAELIEWVADVPLAGPAPKRIFPPAAMRPAAETGREGISLARPLLLAGIAAAAALWLIERRKRTRLSLDSGRRKRHR